MHIVFHDIIPFSKFFIFCACFLSHMHVCVRLHFKLSAVLSRFHVINFRGCRQSGHYTPIFWFIKKEASLSLNMPHIGLSTHEHMISMLFWYSIFEASLTKLMVVYVVRKCIISLDKCINLKLG